MSDFCANALLVLVRSGAHGTPRCQRSTSPRIMRSLRRSPRAVSSPASLSALPILSERGPTRHGRPSRPLISSHRALLTSRSRLMCWPPVWTKLLRAHGCGVVCLCWGPRTPSQIGAGAVGAVGQPPATAPGVISWGPLFTEENRPFCDGRARRARQRRRRRVAQGRLRSVSRGSGVCAGIASRRTCCRRSCYHGPVWVPAMTSAYGFLKGSRMPTA